MNKMETIGGRLYIFGIFYYLELKEKIVWEFVDFCWNYLEGYSNMDIFYF
jgi:hypothetical protein